MSTSNCDVNRDNENNDALQPARKERITWNISWKRGPVSNLLSSLAETLRHRKKDDFTSSTLDHAGQCLFLCLRKQKNYYVVKVPCLRPNPTRRIISKQSRKLPNGRFEFTGDVTYAPLTAAEKAVESNTDIWHRIRETYFEDRGKWRKWLPYYGATLTREIKFQFSGVVDEGSRYPVFNVIPVDLNKVEEWAPTRVIASEPHETETETDYDYDPGSECGGDFHSTACPKSVSPSLNCYMDVIEEAKQRKRKLGMLSQLIDCANHPEKTNLLETLAGMALDSCIYDLEETKMPVRNRPYKGSETMRGIELVMGWQKDRLVSELPLYTLWLHFSLALTYSCVVVWGGLSDDWSAAMGFGQLLAASIALVVAYGCKRLIS